MHINIGVDEPDTGLFPDFPPGSLQLNLFNDGPSTVHVRTVQVDDQAQVPVTFGSDVLPGAATSLTLDLTDRCAADVGRSAHHVTVRLTTVRGQHVARTLPVVPDVVLNTHERQRCGTLLPSEALGSSLLSVRTRGPWVQAELDLRNTSVLPFSVTAIVVPDGLEARLPALPLALPPASAPGTTGPSRRLHLELRVRSCAAFNAGLFGPDPLGEPVRVRLRGPLETETAGLPLQPQQETGTGVDAPDAVLKLMQFCPSFFFG